jgi:ribosomal protein S18 acetylase RimI-like enzyme
MKTTLERVHKPELELAKCVNGFGRDYTKSDNGCVHSIDDLMSYKLQTMLNHHELYYIKVDGEIAGMVELRNKQQVAGPVDRELHMIYVKPEFRGQGVAEATYTLAIDEYGVNMIGITYHRISDMKSIEYFKNIGFNSVNIVPGQKGEGKSMCAIMTDIPYEGTSLLPLTFRGVRDSMHHCNKIGHKLAKKGYLNDVDGIVEVFQNHFANKKLKGQVPVC